MPTLNNSNVHYVKFLRGLNSAWERLLQTPNKIDNDTLYFIYENPENAIEGKLYLGQNLISGSETNIGGTININDLNDIYIDNESLEDKQILVYNETTEQWENVSLATIINTAVEEMVGATAAADGASGLVPVPRAGDHIKFLRGDKTWATINVPTFNTDVFAINNSEVNLIDYDIAPVGSVPIKTNNGIEWSSISVGTVGRQIITREELQEQINNHVASENTIYMILNENDDLSENKYDEYLVVNNRMERIGTFGQVNLNDYVQITTFNTEVQKLENVLYDQQDEQSGEEIAGLITRVNRLEIAQTSFNNKIGDLNQLLLTDNNTTLVEEINSINDRLKWQELEEL